MSFFDFKFALINFHLGLSYMLLYMLFKDTHFLFSSYIY